jgi:tRNA pseudouridine38-40 synthase
VHFNWEGEQFCPDTLVRNINGVANKAVRIRDVEIAPEGFHARYSATARYYQYTFFSRPVALAKDYGWQCGKMHFDLDLMEREAQSFLGTHDFDPFSIPRGDGKSTLCTLSEFRLERRGHILVWHIRGNRFLHRQVRSMVGLLIDVGRGKLPEGSIDRIFAGEFKGERMWAPPEGLCLEDVEY